MKYLPLYLDLRDKPVLVIGNGPETEWKVSQLVQAGAGVRVVSPQPLPEVVQLHGAGKIEYRSGEFREGDLEGVWLVVGTTEDNQLNERIFQTANQRGIFCNIVDVTHLCSFIYPAIVARDDVQIAISTSGNSPALAQRLKRIISAVVGAEYGMLNELLGRVRPRVVRSIPDRARRVRLFHKLVDPVYLLLLRHGRRQEAERKMQKLITKTIAEK